MNGIRPRAPPARARHSFRITAVPVTALLDAINPSGRSPTFPHVAVTFTSTAVPAVWVETSTSAVSAALRILTLTVAFAAPVASGLPDLALAA